MEEVSEKWVEAEAMIQKFKEEFLEKYNAEVYISYRVVQTSAAEPKIPMQYILDDVNMFLADEYPDGITYNDHYNNTVIDVTKDGVRTKSRIPAIVSYRYLFYRICSQLGYNNLQISRFIKGSADHSIVIHGCKTFQRLLDVKDASTVRLHEKIIPYLNNKYELKLK